MDEGALAALLAELQAGSLGLDAAVARLRDLPFEDLGFAKVDHHRALRTGFPEAIYCPGKAVEQVVAIAQALAARASGPILATRADAAVGAAVCAALPQARYHAAARLVTVGELPEVRRTGIAVVAAGTADMPVAEEAALTLEYAGEAPDRLYDIGVAGLHRLLAHQPRLAAAKVIIVVAGMEGALPSVVAGLVGAPVVAVPTSVGYGVAQGGLTAMHAMLTSCAAGLSVVNIDNGFGAAQVAARIHRLAYQAATEGAPESRRNGTSSRG